MALERLQKLLARAGLGSRRACEQIILDGRVTVDGRPVTELGAKADLQVQDVRVNGQRIRPERPEYWILNKPKGVVCTNLDPSGRRRPIDLMRQTTARLFAIGRLDADSKGLLLMTNDGEFANRLAHPRYEVPKTYVATVAGDLGKGDLRRLIRGVWLAEGRTRPAEVRLLKRARSRSVVEVTIREGRNRQIRRVLAKLGHNVRELVRTRIGRISLRGLSVGQSRRLTQEELEYLRRLPEHATPEHRPRPVRPPAAQGAKPRPQAGPTQGGAGPPRRPKHAATQQTPAGAAAGPTPMASADFRGIKEPRERHWRREPRPEERAEEPQAPHPFEKHRRLKGSPKTHDSDGVGQTGQGDRRHPGRGRGGRRGGRGGPPRRGRRPYRHPPQ
jgi:23S rRNA pseudouridine2605 synthase